MNEQRPVIKIHTIEVIDPSGRLNRHKIEANTVYIYQTTAQAEDVVSTHTSPPTDLTLRWQLQVVAHNQRCQIINLTTEEQIRFDWGTVESDHWKVLKADQPPDEQSVDVNYEHPFWINQKVGLIFYRRKPPESIQVQLWPDGGIELTEKHTKALESWDQHDHPLTWIVRLRHPNQIETTVQFHLEANVDRLPRSAYRFDTLHPKLNLVNYQEINLTFFQSLDEPVEAGDYVIGITARAEEYPNEVAQDFQLLRVAPFYRHELGFEDDSASANS